MTTEREREARELLARECEREGAIWTASVLRNGEEPSKADRIAIRAIVAALTREQEAQGTVACKRARVVGWWNCDCAECREHAKQNTIATPPAPVDVRAKVEAALRGAKDLQEGVQRVCALLSVQPAGVDDAMVERAHEEYVRVAGDGSYVPVDEVALRAALEAALGGGGGR